jgi:RIH domain/RyR and IP3R Homology associated/Inositol 1,4,5-trisphosphate/ryanodine receptor
MDLKLQEEQTNDETIQSMKGKYVCFGTDICI